MPQLSAGRQQQAVTQRVLRAAVLGFSLLLGAQAVVGARGAAFEGHGQDGTGSIEGRVVDQSSGLPLEGVRVAQWRGSRREETKTTAEGLFRFDGVEPGEVSLSFEKEGYCSINPFASGLESMPRTKIRAGETARIPAVGMTRESSVSGEARDRETRKPLGGFSVTAFQFEYTESGKVLIPRGRATVQSSDGGYQLTGLQPGDYLLEVSPPVGERIGRPHPERKERDQEGNRGHPRWYYPGLTEAELALPFPLAPGAQLRGVDFLIPELRLISIRGSLETPHRVKNVTMLLMEAGRSFARILSRGQLDGPGPFEITGVIPGRWTLTAWASGQGGARLFASADLVVTDRDMEDVELLLRPGEPLQGEVVLAEDERGSKLPQGLRVWLRAAGRLDFQDERNRADVDEGGRFHLPFVLPGGYVVELHGLPQGYFVRQVLLGGHPAKDGRISFGKGEMERTLTIEISGHAGALSGQVVARDGGPVAGARVVAVPLPLPEDGTPALGRIRTVETGEQGLFSISPVTPGDYLIFAFPSLPRGQQYNVGFLKAHARSAAEVRVQSKQAATVRATLIPPARQ
jgi:hypothetical protein